MMGNSFNSLHFYGQSSSSFSVTYVILPFLLYLFLVKTVRSRRLRSTVKEFPYTSRDSFASMSLEDAFYIQQKIGELEFPFIHQKALQFALFRTYGIPSISKLLVQTTEFTSGSTASKRYVDTEVLVAEFYGYHPQHSRVTEAIARMNYIHSVYRKAGKISDEDMLYTLSLFAMEPIRWIERHEWRSLEAFEKNAIAVFVKALGDAMDIRYAGFLKGAEAGWKDGLHWLEEIDAWAQAYEQRAMVPDINNFKTAEHTMNILLWFVPGAAKGVGKKLVCTLLDERLRQAMMYEKPPKFYCLLVSHILWIRAFILRYLFLPRPNFFRKHHTSYKSAAGGNRYHLNIMETAPYYVKPTIWNRYGPFSWVFRMMGLPLPGDEGDKYYPQGFTVETVGPRSLHGKGSNYVEESKVNIIRMRESRCPFTGTVK